MRSLQGLAAAAPARVTATPITPPTTVTTMLAMQDTMDAILQFFAIRAERLAPSRSPLFQAESTYVCVCVNMCVHVGNVCVYGHW